MSDQTDPKLQRHSGWLVCLLLVAVAFGGGGVRYGLMNLVVQLTALFILFFHRAEVAIFLNRAPLSLKLLIAFTIALPLLQLVPLPERVLSNLPAREPVVEARALAGVSGWFPLSTDAGRTLVSLTGLILPMVVLIVASAQSTKRLIAAGWALVAAALATMALGTIQVISAGEIGLLYPENPMPGVLFGTFANRNSVGLFFVGILTLAALLPLPQRLRPVPFIRICICALLILVVLLTRSRSAILLALFPLALAAAKVISEHAVSRWKFTGLLAAAIAILVASFALMGSDNRIAQSLERFEAREDARADIWDDAVYSAQRYWPVGAGMGTFDEIFQQDESLENLAPRRAGRAHNDYLEVVIEAGLPGVTLIGGWLMLIAWLSWRARLSPIRWKAWAGSAILFAIAAQSVIDYPLRSQTMLGFGAFALALLWQLGAVRQERHS